MTEWQQKLMRTSKPCVTKFRELKRSVTKNVQLGSSRVCGRLIPPSLKRLKPIWTKPKKKKKTKGMISAKRSKLVNLDVSSTYHLFFVLLHNYDHAAVVPMAYPLDKETSL